MTFQSAMFPSRLNSVKKPVLYELNIGPNFRALIKHSSNDWVGAGGRLVSAFEKDKEQPPPWSEHALCQHLVTQSWAGEARNKRGG